MAKIRVRQLARELGLSRKEAVERLAEAGIPVRGPSSFVDDAAARAALSTIETSEGKLPEEPTRDKSTANPKRAKRAKKRKKKAKPVAEPQAGLELSAAAPEELAGINLPEEVTKDKAVAKEERGKRTKKRKKKTRPVPEPYADLKPSPEAPDEVAGIKPEPISFHTEERLPEEEISPPPTEPPPTPSEAETLTEPPMELEPPQVEVYPPEGPVMEESAPEEEQPAPGTGETVAPTEPPEVEEPVSPAITLKPGQEPELVKRVADELGFDVEAIPGAPPEGKDPSPVSKVIRIPEMITVRELSEKLAISSGEIIKELKKMGIVATLDWSLNPGLSRRVAAEFGFDVEVARVEVELLEVMEVMGNVDLGETPETEQWEDEDQHRLKLDDIHQRIKQGQVRVKVRGGEEERERRISSSPAPAIPTKTAPQETWDPSGPSPVPPVWRVSKELWLLAGAIVAVALVALGVPRERGTQSPGATTSSNDKAQRVVAATPPAKIEKPAPRSSGPLREWKVLHHSPRAGQKERSRRGAIRIFFNRPVEQDVVEHAFDIEPNEPGTFSWPKADRLVFTPTDPFAPATEYTVSLTSMMGPYPDEEYKLLGARWSFTTGANRTYGKDIKPLMAAYCSKCHGPGGQAARIPLQTYGDVSKYVVAGQAEQSRLYTFVQERQHHINMAGPDHSTNDKLAIIRDWINVDKAVE